MKILIPVFNLGTLDINTGYTVATLAKQHLHTGQTTLHIAHAGLTAFTLHTGRYLHCTHWTAFTHGLIIIFHTLWPNNIAHTGRTEHWQLPVFIHKLRSTLHHTQAKQHCTLLSNALHTGRTTYSTQAEKHFKEPIHVFSFCKAEWNTGICCSKVNTGID